MWNAQDDPLGIALGARARDARALREAQDRERGIWKSPIGPMPDPQWDKYFQALEEAGVDRVGDMSAAPKQVQDSGSPFSVGYANADRFQQSAALDSLKSRNPSDQRLSYLRGRSANPAMNSLKRGK